MKRLMQVLDQVVIAVEVLVAIGLVLMAIGAVWELALQLVDVITAGVALPPKTFNRIIGIVLEVFIIIELFRIAVAYMKHQNVVPTVLEAALVAVARKFVVFEGATNYMQYAIGLAVLLLAVAAGWFLLERSHACELNE